MVREVDDHIQGLLRSLPAFTHEDTVNILFNYKFVELIYFVVYASGIYIHYTGQIQGLQKLVGPLDTF